MINKADSSLRPAFERIRDERRTAANTATRIGNAFLSIIPFLDRTLDIFLSKIEDDRAEGFIEFMRGLKSFGTIFLGEYAEGLAGGKLTEEGYAELESLWVRTFAKFGDGLQHQDIDGKAIPALQVDGDSAFSGNLSSTDFVSAFFGGLGWAIQKIPYTNASGQTEYKYSLEIDNVTVRNALRVFEMIISQLLGENGNRFFSDMMEVDHYDPSTGKVWLKTGDGKLYNSLRVGDIVVVQQYNGDPTLENDWNVTKAYEFRVTAVGVGDLSLGENRLDWLEFENFTSTMENMTPELAFRKGDTLVRADNDVNPNRKGLVTVMSVGDNTPYIDVLYGMKTDPDDALKGRIGNLQGIRHHLFGWLKGFGEYLINAYVVGDVRLRRTGESLDTLVEILNGLLSTKISETVYELTDDDNFISNAKFTDINEDGSLKNWTVSNDNVGFWTVGGDPVVSSIGTPVNVSSAVKTVEQDGRMVLHIVNGSVSQSRTLMRTPGTHKEYNEGSEDTQTTTYNTVLDTLYLSVRIRVIKDGTLTIGFPSSTETEVSAIKGKTSILQKSDGWTTYQWSGTWDGQSDFVLGFTGECYISVLSLTTEPLNTFKTEYSTQIRQTSRNISLVATKSSDNASSIASLTIEAGEIRSTVEENYTDLDGRVTSNASAITQTAAAIRLEVQSVSDDLDGVADRVGTLEVHDTDITLRVSDTETSISSLGDDIDDLSDDLDTAKGNITRITERVGTLEVTSSSITGRVSTVETTVSGHTTDISNLGDDIDGLSDDLDTAKGNITSITERVGTLEVTSSSITGRVSTVETTVSGHTTDISNLGDDIDGLSDDLDTANGNITSITERVGTLEVTSSSITGRVSTVETTVSGHTTDISNLGDDIDGLSDDLDTANANITSITSRVGTLEVHDTNITSRVSAVESRPMQICDIDGWEQGTTNESTGYGYDSIKADDNTRIRTKNLYPVTDATVCMLSNSGRSNFSVFFVYFTRYKVVCSTAGSGWRSQANNGGKIDVSAPSDCAFVAVLMRKQDNGNISVDDVKSSGITITSDKIVSQAEISSFIEDKDGVTLSHIRLSADVISHIAQNITLKAERIDFVTDGWSVKNSSNIETLKLDQSGNLTIKGEINGGSIKGTLSVASNMEFNVSGTKFARFASTVDYSAMLAIRHDGGSCIEIGSYDYGTGIRITANTGSKGIVAYGPEEFYVRTDEYFQIQNGVGTGFFAPGCCVKNASFTLPANPKNGTLFFLHGALSTNGSNQDLVVTTRSHPIMEGDGRGNRCDAYSTVNFTDASLILVFFSAINKWVIFNCW